MVENDATVWWSKFRDALINDSEHGFRAYGIEENLEYGDIEDMSYRLADAAMVAVGAKLWADRGYVFSNPEDLWEHNREAEDKPFSLHVALRSHEARQANYIWQAETLLGIIKKPSNH